MVTSDTLYLMQINPDNSSSSTILSATTQNETQYPGNIIPDGNGGVLATWSVSMVQGTQPTYPYEAVDFSGGVVGTPYNLPFSPQSVNITKQPDLVLGENGVAFAKGSTTVPINGVQTTVDQIASFNIGSGAVNWTYQATSGTSLSLVEATAGNGLAARSTGQTGADTILIFSPGGTPSGMNRARTTLLGANSAAPPDFSGLPVRGRLFLRCPAIQHALGVVCGEVLHSYGAVSVHLRHCVRHISVATVPNRRRHHASGRSL